jgi:hypothetical protein
MPLERAIFSYWFIVVLRRAGLKASASPYDLR